MAVKKDFFACHGASNHSTRERAELDYYATPPEIVEELLQYETFDNSIWEPAVGGGAISEVLKYHGYDVLNSDIIDHGYPSTKTIDFLKYDNKWDGDIITNPPYKYAKEFAEKALEVVQTGRKVAMFLKLTFLEGKKRATFFEKYPPKFIYVLRSRVDCALNGDFSIKPSKAVCYAWFIWIKGENNAPQIKWMH